MSVGSVCMEKKKTKLVTIRAETIDYVLDRLTEITLATDCKAAIEHCEEIRELLSVQQIRPSRRQNLLRNKDHCPREERSNENNGEA
jgi:hypothetical protein